MTSVELLIEAKLGKAEKDFNLGERVQSVISNTLVANNPWADEETLATLRIITEVVAKHCFEHGFIAGARTGIEIARDTFQPVITDVREFLKSS